MSVLAVAVGQAVHALRKRVIPEQAAAAAECARTAFGLDAYAMGMAMAFVQVRRTSEPRPNHWRARCLMARLCSALRLAIT